MKIMLSDDNTMKIQQLANDLNMPCSTIVNQIIIQIQKVNIVTDLVIRVEVQRSKDELKEVPAAEVKKVKAR